jgi:hypothetical protein
MGLIHGDSDLLRLLESARRSAQYVRMRSMLKSTDAITPVATFCHD